MSRPLTAVLAAVFAAVGLQACYSCTLIGCSDALSVRLVAPDGFAPGAYTVDLQGDTAETCTFTVLGPDDCTDGDWCVEGSGACDVARDGDEIQFGVEPIEGAVVVVVDLDGTVVAEDTFTPEYDESQPNGPHCGPTCRSAAVELTL